MKRPSKDACTALIEAIDAYVEKADNDLLAQLKNAGYQLPKETLDEINELADRLTKQLGTRGKAVYDRFVQAVNPIKWQAATNLDSLHLFGLMSDEDQAERIERYAREFRDAYKKLLPPLIQGYSHEVDHSLAIQGITKRTQAWMRQWPTQTACFIEQGIRNDLMDILDSALKKGESVDKVQQRIMDSNIRNPEWKARRMALTEMLRAHSYAQLEAYRMNPAVHQKRWVHTGAKFSEPRANHLQYSGTIVGMNEKFTLPGSGATCDCPRDTSLPPGESINCHCLMQPVVDHDKLGLSLAERERLYREAVENDDRKWEEELDREKHQEADAYRGELLPGISVRKLDGKGYTDIDIGEQGKSMSRASDIALTNSKRLSDKTGDYKNNCQRCLPTYELRRRGYDVVAKPKPFSSKDPFENGTCEWYQTFDTGQLRMVRCDGVTWQESKAKVEEEVRSWGDNARGGIYITWPPDPDTGAILAHTYNVEITNGKISYIDAQCVTDASHYLEEANPANTRVFRLDNVDFTEALEACCEKRSQ